MRWFPDILLQRFIEKIVTFSHLHDQFSSSVSYLINHVLDHLQGAVRLYQMYALLHEEIRLQTCKLQSKKGSNRPALRCCSHIHRLSSHLSVDISQLVLQCFTARLLHRGGDATVSQGFRQTKEPEVVSSSVPGSVQSAGEAAESQAAHGSVPRLERRCTLRLISLYV